MKVNNTFVAALHESTQSQFYLFFWSQIETRIDLLHVSSYFIDSHRKLSLTLNRKK